MEYCNYFTYTIFYFKDSVLSTCLLNYTRVINVYFFKWLIFLYWKQCVSIASFDWTPRLICMNVYTIIITCWFNLYKSFYYHGSQICKYQFLVTLKLITAIVTYGNYYWQVLYRTFHHAIQPWWKLAAILMRLMEFKPVPMLLALELW